MIAKRYARISVYFQCVMWIVLIWCAQSKESVVYPTELDAFVDKRMLFKVEVGDGNLHRSWRSYTVKKLTQEDDIINRFLTLHGLNVCLMQ